MRVLPLLALASTATVHGFPHFRSRSLAGLSEEEVARITRALTASGDVVGSQPLPPPISDTSSKLIHDKEHPYVAPGPNDVRGPCPGLNTLANHGYLNRTGIVTPGEIITAVQEGFNMGYQLAIFVTYAAFIVDGNPLTNLMSLGHKSSLTGEDPPSPATVGGLSQHSAFEGDSSTTRSDAAIGDNTAFNETLFQELATAAKTLGNGRIDFAASQQFRYDRIQHSIANNPTFDMTSPRFFTVYAETTFPLRLFPNGTTSNSATPSISIEDARSFFETSKFPEGWFRREGPFDFDEISPDIRALYAAHPILPGKNNGAGNYVADLNDPGFLTGIKGLCYAYDKQVNQVLTRMYPSPTGELRDALNGNLDHLYQGFAQIGCEQQYPYGK